MSKRVAKLLKYGITGGLCLIIAIVIAVSQGLFQATAWTDRFRILSDAFYVPGILLIFWGLLTWLSGEGAFMGISYACKQLVRLFVPASMVTQESYKDYVARKQEKEKTPFGFLFIVGGVYFAISLVFLGLFYLVR